jgi:hypothetical protein
VPASPGDHIAGFWAGSPSDPAGGQAVVLSLFLEEGDRIFGALAGLGRNPILRRRVEEGPHVTAGEELLDVFELGVAGAVALGVGQVRRPAAAPALGLLVGGLRALDGAVGHVLEMVFAARPRIGDQQDRLFRLVEVVDRRQAPALALGEGRRGAFVGAGADAAQGHHHLGIGPARAAGERHRGADVLLAEEALVGQDAQALHLAAPGAP